MATLKRDGVSLFYEEAMGAKRPLLFVHGWCCDHSFFAPQFAHFAQQGHRVVAVDLRGHGASEKPRQDYTMQLFADDLAFVVRELGLEEPVVIGHSMGGVVAFAFAARHAELPSAIVTIDAGLTPPQTVGSALAKFIDGLRGPGYRKVIGDYADAVLFLPTDDAERRARILSIMTRAPQHVMISALQGGHAYDADEAKGRLIAPMLYIAADEWPPRADIARLRALVPRFYFGQVVGSGHFCQLEVPEQVNAMIDRFLVLTESV
ncbi:alpha/beta hydrolase [Methyloceanibacter sp.]|uniref:alpha/beta fold hydrolase n=1 Tax=Methyloceanibacter sp. TaxID=1965321 RepID=UPI002D6CAFE2|nr:alpha/beta hydrolase [Methyloceanibacter sp.]HZP10469.1 alpha/beta hydrolase [Methyloceanibacter sp.]